MRYMQESCFGVALAGVASIGFLMGQIWEQRTIVPSIPLMMSDVQTKRCTVALDEVSDGAVRGHVEGNVRLYVGREGHEFGSGAFSIPVSTLHTVVRVTVPPDARYVASKKGKIAYSIGSKSAARIAPERRRYFRTAEEARTAGFTPR